MISKKFTAKYRTRWSDVDANNHVRHSVYLDLCASARMDWLESVGFSGHRLFEMSMGPVLFREEIFYKKELPMGEEVSIQLHITAMSESGHKFSLEHHLFNSKQEPVAQLNVDGAWFNTKDRKVCPPGDEMMDVMKSVLNVQS